MSSGDDSAGESRPLLAQASGSRDTFGRNQLSQRRQTQDSSRSSNREAAGDGDANGGEREVSWREWMGETLESPRTHKIVLTLIAIDACCVLADLAYEFLSPDKGCDTASSLFSDTLSLSLAAAAASSTSNPPAGHQAALISSTAIIRSLVLEGADDPTWLTVLAHVSLVINALFVLEIPLAVWCFGLAYYVPFSVHRRRTRPLESASRSRSADDAWEDTDRDRDRDVERGAPANSKSNASSRARGKATGQSKTGMEMEKETHPYAALHLFDALVVLATFVLEVVLRGRERELAGLLVLLRLWRLVKLVGGIAVGAGEIQEELSEELADKEAQLQAARARIAALEAENAGLKARGGSDANVNVDVGGRVGGRGEGEGDGEGQS